MKQPQASDMDIALFIAARLHEAARHTNGHWQYLIKGEWRDVRGPSSPLWAHVDRIRAELPADRYWDRARHRLSNISSTYTLLALVARELRTETEAS